MTKITTISFSYLEYDNIKELDPDDMDLVVAARESALNAYAPYSKFRVGAAIRLNSGLIISGTNVENAVFPSGICAERSALAYSVSNHSDDSPTTLAVSAFTENGLTDDPVPPCGNCRQVISEEESRTGSKIRIILSGKNKTLIIESIRDLLPMQFNQKNLHLNLH